MPDPISARVPVAAETAIARAASATGVDFALLVATARRESGFNVRAQAQTSSARGMFQFVENTWLDLVRRHGADHGLAAYAGAIGVRNDRPHVGDAGLRQDILALRDDPETAARLAGELTRENATYLSSRLGRAPNANELYAAHVLGAAGAARLVEACERGAPNAAALFPREAEANARLFHAHGAPLSASALLQRLSIGDEAASPPSPARCDAAMGPLSPQLARALFELALMPLLASPGEEEREQELMGGAYFRSPSI